MALEQAKPYPKPVRAEKAAPKRLKSTRRSKDSRAAGLFREIVCADDDCLAEGLGECEPPLQAAHVVPAALLHRLGRDDLVYQTENGVALCYRHHRRVTTGLRSSRGTCCRAGVSRGRKFMASLTHSKGAGPHER